MSRVEAVDSWPRRLLTSSTASPSSRSPITAEECRRSCLCRRRHNHDYADIRVMPTGDTLELDWRCRSRHNPGRLAYGEPVVQLANTGGTEVGHASSHSVKERSAWSRTAPPPGTEGLDQEARIMPTDWPSPNSIGTPSRHNADVGIIVEPDALRASLDDLPREALADGTGVVGAAVLAAEDESAALVEVVPGRAPLVLRLAPGRQRPHGVVAEVDRPMAGPGLGRPRTARRPLTSGTAAALQSGSGPPSRCPPSAAPATHRGAARSGRPGGTAPGHAGRSSGRSSRGRWRTPPRSRTRSGADPWAASRRPWRGCHAGACPQSRPYCARERQRWMFQTLLGLSPLLVRRLPDSRSSA